MAHRRIATLLLPGSSGSRPWRQGTSDEHQERHLHAATVAVEARSVARTVEEKCIVVKSYGNSVETVADWTDGRRYLCLVEYGATDATEQVEAASATTSALIAHCTKLIESVSGLLCSLSWVTPQETSGRGDSAASGAKLRRFFTRE